MDKNTAEKWINEVCLKTNKWQHHLINSNSGFAKYSQSGDYLSEKNTWGLGNVVFTLKNIYVLDAQKNFSDYIPKAFLYLDKFREADNFYSDPFIRKLSFPRRLFAGIKNISIKKISYQPTKIAETRQTWSVLKLYGKLAPANLFPGIPATESEIMEFLQKLDWTNPWGAGSHFSHLLFFLENSNHPQKKTFIEKAILWLRKIYHPETGTWSQGTPSKQKEINGVMKIITGLNAVNSLHHPDPRKLIDTALESTVDLHACDNFNIVYILRHIGELTNFDYRYEEIKKFTLNRLNTFKEFYHQDSGGFSFHRGKANNLYYDALITRGKPEPDVHGTTMFLWGLAMISKILKINTPLKEYHA